MLNINKVQSVFIAPGSTELRKSVDGLSLIIIHMIENEGDEFMASYVYVKNPNGTTYVYENTSVWNKEKKRPDTYRKAVGKLDSITGEIIFNSEKKTLKMSMRYGNIYFLNELVSKYRS